MEDVAVAQVPPASPKTNVRLERERNRWDICCSKTDRRALKFLVQVIFGLSIVIFSMVMIVVRVDQDNAVFYSMLSGTVGLFLPHPTINKEEPDNIINRPQLRQLTPIRFRTIS